MCPKREHTLNWTYQHFTADRKVIEDHSGALQYISFLEEEQKLIPILRKKYWAVQDKLVSLSEANDTLKQTLSLLTKEHTKHMQMYKSSLADLKRVESSAEVYQMTKGKNVTENDSLPDRNSLPSSSKQYTTSLQTVDNLGENPKS